MKNVKVELFELLPKEKEQISKDMNREKKTMALKITF